MDMLPAHQREQGRRFQRLTDERRRARQRLPNLQRDEPITINNNFTNYANQQPTGDTLAPLFTNSTHEVGQSSTCIYLSGPSVEHDPQLLSTYIPDPSTDIPQSRDSQFAISPMAIPAPHTSMLMDTDTMEDTPGDTTNFMVVPLPNQGNTAPSQFENILRPPTFCSFCSAKKFSYDSKGFCCSQGQIRLQQPSPPPELHTLYTAQDKNSRMFRKWIRGYNSAFAFTSFGVTPKPISNTPAGPFCFKIQGQIYHRIDHLVPENQKPSFLQLYIYDTEHELPNRFSYFSNNLSLELMEQLTRLLDQYNPLVQVLRSLKDKPNFEEFVLTINKNTALDQRVYNSPTTDQVAAVWVEGGNPKSDQERFILLEPRQGQCSLISANSGCYDPLQYPLLFPHGETRWQDDIEKAFIPSQNQRKTVSHQEYYAFKLQIRPNDNSILLYAGKLLHQYLVDMYVKIETDRLNFFRRHQKTIRAELYKGLHDSIIDGETEGNSIGRIVLPSSFTGGIRDVQARYRDAMAIVGAYGKPDLFITMTCNPNWTEIKQELYEGQCTSDRPDLCVRIFYGKLRDLLHTLIHQRFFGLVSAYVVVIEFQKRGLPHAHMLLILAQQYKPRNPEDYDKIVSAEIPDISISPELHKKVCDHMMHGPCGNGISSPCTSTGSSCKFHYPRCFTHSTTHNTDSYVLYRRSDSGRKVQKRGIWLDNRWVVPYSPQLMLMFNCHLNVEICSSIQSVKYLYKYLYKGHDRIQFSLEPANTTLIVDEIKRYQNARWISSTESAWRIFGYELFFMVPSVYHLPLHLPEEQQIYFQENADIVSLLQNDSNKKTMLTEFFAMNNRSDILQNLLYKDFPTYYVWNKKDKLWTKRKKAVVIGRVYTANPKEGDRYYLRLLLNHVRNPRSFDDLKIVDGVMCQTFKESCILRGLLQDDNAVVTCLAEAEAYQMPQALRELFCTILVFCEPTHVRLLWDQFWKAMAEDYTRDVYSEEQLQCLVLQDINQRLRENQKSISDYDLPAITTSINNLRSNAPLIEEELKVKTPYDDLQCFNRLNEEQLKAFLTIRATINLNDGGVFFVDGPGGTGKTYLYRALLAYVRETLKEIAIATASSGIAAVNMPGGRTAHSRFKIPLKLNETSTCHINKQSDLARLLRISRLFIWDEAPMMHKYAFEALDRTMQDIMGTTKLFGGKLFILGGDFRQILPVIPKGTRGRIVDCCLIYSFLWPSVTVLKLTKNMRALLDPDYAAFVLRIGNGTEPTFMENLIKIPSEMIVESTSHCAAKATLINKVFPGIKTERRNKNWIAERVILAPTNEQVNEINQDILDLFPDQEVLYYSYDSVKDDKYNLYAEEFLNRINPNGFPLHELRVKVGCTVMLLRNLNPSAGLCNGTRLTCKTFDRNVIEAEIITGQQSGTVTFIPRIPMIPSDDANLPFILKRRQFPLKLAFAVTINKSQGQTIPYAGIYLPQPVFTHGQLYVALSRGINISDTHVYVKDGVIRGFPGTFTNNIVYTEVLT